MTKNPSERRAQRTRSRRLTFFVVGMVIFLSYMARAFFGESGILVGLQVKSEYHRLVARNQQLIEENAQLTCDIRDLQSSGRKLESIGRSEFGFGRPGEVIFRFPPQTEEKPRN